MTDKNAAFSIHAPDFTLSPATGMNRDHWLDAGKHILQGAFQHVNDFKDPMFLPKQPGKSYPVEGNENASPQQHSAAIFEAIARTANVAFPLLHDDPELTLNGIHLGDYYRYHLLELLTNEDSHYFIGKEAAYEVGVQQTCELGNLAMWCIMLPDVFWDRLTKEEQDAVAKTWTEWGEGKTYPHNWRWFNVMMLSFLDLNGYPCNLDTLQAHLDHLLLHYAGDGWYRDSSYDYYSIHVFHLYGRVWNRCYGNKRSPARAKMIDDNFEAFIKDYPIIFSKAGHINMYGRSILYRLGASSGMPAAFIGEAKDLISPGHARRIASASLLQFISHPDFFHQGIPALGFYGPFEPAIQDYSCSASPYWMFLNFIALALPKDDSFWTATEENPTWDSLGDGLHNTFHKSAGLLISNHGNSGTSELRPCKVHTDNPNYCRLVYNTAFPWEANQAGGATAASLSLKTHDRDEHAYLPEYIDSAGYRDDVLYRQACYRGQFAPHVDMASIVIPNGEIRVERVRKTRGTTVYLGHLSMPHMQGQPPTQEAREIDGHPSRTLSIPGRQLAMTLYSGWDTLGVRLSRDHHPEAPKSSLLFARREDPTPHGQVETLVSILLHKTDDSSWSDEVLNPIQEITALVPGLPLHLGGLKIRLKNGTDYNVDFKEMDGTCSRG